MTNNESTNDNAEQPVTPADMPQKQAEPTGEQPAEQPDEQADEQADEHTTFSREYVEELRGEAAKYRTRAKHTEEVERRLHDALVRLDGRLHDASDLDFDPDRLEGDGGVEAAITALLEAKPHLAKRAPSGDVGAGVRGEVDAAPDLISIMRGM